MICEDIWVRYTPKGGVPYTSYHQVWDKVRFWPVARLKLRRTVVSLNK